MRVSMSSGNSRRSRSASGWAGILICAVVLTCCSAAVIYFVQADGSTLFYGDAAAHLNIARRLFDGRNPGYEQIGTVWLPLPHLLMMPFARVDAWWHSGLAGAIPSGVAWVVAGTFLFSALRRWLGNEGAFAGVAVFALQPNLLYLQACPMNEPLFLAGSTGLLLFTSRAVEEAPLTNAFLAGVCGIAATLTRYDGWFLLPVAALYLLIRSGKAAALLFCLVAGLGPFYWLAHNAILYSDPLEFYHGIGSAKDIQKQLPYPGAHDWGMAIRQFAIATKAVLGWPLIAISSLGLIWALKQRLFWPLLFCSLAPVYYVVNLYGGDSPIYIPEVYPFSHYNSRYALAALPLFAVCTAALASALPRLRWILPMVALSWFAFNPVLVKTEGAVNSESRRAWTNEVAALLKAEYQPGTGILMPFGDLTGILEAAQIPIRECIHQGDKLEFDRAIARPDLFLNTAWVIAQSGDRASDAMVKARAQGLPYRCVKLISLKYAPVLEVWRRVGSQ